MSFLILVFVVYLVFKVGELKDSVDQINSRLSYMEGILRRKDGER